MQPRTPTLFIETTHGPIPSIAHNGMACVVKVSVKKKAVETNSCGLPVPLVRDGHYIHAVPGGGEIVGAPCHRDA